MEHRHEASYRYVLSTANGVERGTCACGLRVTRRVADGVTPAANREAWVVVGGQA